MLRALIAAALLWTGFAGTAQACLGTNLHRGIIYDEIPWDAPADALILRVEFNRGDVRRLAGPRPTDPAHEWLLMQRVAVDARVIEVIRGDHDRSTVRVAIGGSSCDSPFIFGRRGLIIGTFVTPADGQARYDAAEPNPNLRFTWEFGDTVFVALEETRDDRDLRHAGLTRVNGGPFVSGDYDGDGRTDTARFFEDMEGVLHVGVQLGARRRDHVERIWGGDISSLPYYTFRTAPPGDYTTACELYGDDCGGAPRRLSLRHDGLIVEALESGQELLYYWHDQSFQNVIIAGQ